MTVWTGTVYLVDGQGRDHVAGVTLPGPLSLSRDRIGGLDLPDGFRVLAASGMAPAEGGAASDGVHDLHPQPWRNRPPGLAIEEIFFESPPRMASTLPCPERLAEALLPAIDGTRLYLLFDAAKLAPLMRVFDPADLLAGLSGRSLFLSEGMAAQSPWLVDVTPEPDGTAPRLLRRFLQAAWNQRAGLFLRSRAGFDELFRFLRGFTRVRSGAKADKTTLLRFWDPLVARHWFAAQDRDPDRVRRLFWTPSDAPVAVIGETGATGFFRLSPAALNSDGAGRKGLLTLGDADMRALHEASFAMLGRELSAWMMAARPDRFAGFTHRQVALMEAHVLSVGQQFSLRRKEDFAALMHAMVQIGGWFHQSGAAPELVNILSSGGAALGDRLSAALAETAPQMPQGLIAARWPELSARLAAIPSARRLDSDAFRALVADIAPGGNALITTAIQAALRDIAGLGLSRNDTGIVLGLTLIYGHRYYSDPMRAWAIPAPIEPDKLILLASKLWPGANTAH